MRAHKIAIRTLPLKDDPRGFSLEELIEQMILNTPPGGSTTEQLIKSGVLYTRFKDDQKKNDGAESWDWWLDKDLYATLVVQLDCMRWATTSGEIRLLILGFVKEIRESKEIEVAIVVPPAEPSPPVPQAIP